MNKIATTLALIVVNVLVFAWIAFLLGDVLMNNNNAVLTILQHGANFNPLTINDQWWRLITSMFLHFGILHLLVNMIGLFNSGSFLEPYLGRLRFVLVYFICGIGSGLGSLAWNEFVISAGASGALFGLYGYSIAFEVLSNISDRNKLGGIFIGFFVFVVINTAVTFQISVDIWGHVFGFITGAVLAVLVEKFKVLVEAWQLALVLVALPFLIIVLPHDQSKYYNIFQNVVDAERRTNALFSNSTSDTELHDGYLSLLPKWDSILVSIRKLERVPPSILSDTTVIRQYSELRKRELEYRITMMERDSYIYLDSLDWVGEAIGSLPPLEHIFVMEPDTVQKKEKEQKGPPPVASLQAKVLYDKSWKETTDEEKVMYYREGSRDSLGRWQGKLRDYYKNGDVQMRGTYTNDLKDGIFIYYSERRTYQSSGRFDREQSVGKWEFFHWNGALFQEVRYGRETLTTNVYDSLGNRQVSGGYGKEITWYPSGQIREEGSYVAGKREGYWHGYYPDGKPMYEEYFQNNRLIRGQSGEAGGVMHVYDELSLFPVPVKGMKAFRDYVDENKKRPANAPSGSVEIIFTVGIDNSIWDIAVLSSLHPECDAEAMRLVREGPAWRPGLLHGITPVQGTGYVVIKF